MSSRMNDYIFKELSWFISNPIPLACCKNQILIITKWDPGQDEAVVTCDKCMGHFKFTEDELLAMFQSNPFASEHTI